jgi:cytochrome c oxidase subunit 3
MDYAENDMKIVERPSRVLSMDPKKFILWLFIVAIIMLFASLTSAYIVRRAEGNWMEFELPSVFWLNSFIIVLSSFTMQMSLWMADRDRLKPMKWSLVATAILGLSFLVGQWYSWAILVDHDVFFVGNPSGSFLYVLTGTHAFHIISALVFLLIVLFLAFKYRIHSKNRLWLELCTIYWHFLDILWLYLFGFLLINH